jgi:hypothetical protein
MSYGSDVPGRDSSSSTRRLNGGEHSDGGCEWQLLFDVQRVTCSYRWKHVSSSGGRMGAGSYGSTKRQVTGRLPGDFVDGRQGSDIPFDR